MEYYVIVFANTHTAISVEKYLSADFKIAIMPTLREISKSCGISVRLESEDYPTIRERMSSSDFDPTMYHFYHVVKEDGQNKVTPIE